MSKKEIREIAGVLGVILSMLFVGVEIRQNTAVARAQARQFLTESHREYVLTLAENPELLAAVSARFPAGDEMTPAERRAGYAMFVWLRHLENVCMQVDEGVADESVLQSYAWSGQTNFGSPAFESFWAGSRNRFNPHFVVAFENEYPNLAP